MNRASVSSAIIRGAFFVSLATLLARAGSFLGNIVVIRLLEVEAVGELALIEGWVTMATTFSALGVALALTRYVAEYRAVDVFRAGNIVGVSFLLSGATTFVASFGIYLFFSGGSRNLVNTTVDMLASYSSLFILLIVVYTFRHHLHALLYGMEAFSSLYPISLVTGLLTFPVLYYFTQARGLSGVLEAKALLAIVELLLLARTAWQVLGNAGIKIRLQNIRKDSATLLTFGFPHFIGQVAAEPTQTVMMSVLAAQPAGLAQLGLLSVANRLQALINLLPGSMGKTLIPILSREWGQNRGRFPESVLIAIRLLWATNLPVVLFLLATTRTMIAWLYGKEFAEGWFVAFLLLLVTLLSYINQTLDRTFAAAERIWLSTGNNLLWAVLFFTLAVFLIPVLGAVGYALSFVLSFAAYVFWQLWLVERLFQVTWRPLFPLLFLSVGVCVIAYFINQHTASYEQIALALLLVIATVILEWLTIFSSDERARIVAKLRTIRTFRLVPLASNVGEGPEGV